MLVTKAGLAVSRSKEKKTEMIETQIYGEFSEAVKAVTLPSSFAGFDRDCFMRTKNFYLEITRLDASDLHTGSTLWRKYKEIRLILMNDFAPLLSRRMPGGQPPSGKSFSEILVAVRKDIYDMYEDESEKKSKALKGYKRHPFLESWYPPEWETFITYGAGSPNPADSLNAR